MLPDRQDFWAALEKIYTKNDACEDISQKNNKFHPFQISNRHKIVQKFLAGKIFNLVWKYVFYKSIL
jgi:hypothetical protein